jgi:tetratricopeptide (TPR) repeat protein
VQVTTQQCRRALYAKNLHLKGESKMKRFCFLTVAVLVLFTACSTWKDYPVPKEYRSYSETIEIPGKDAAEIHRKTDLWLTKQLDAKIPYNSRELSESEKEIKIAIFASGYNFFNNSISFHIENERCQLSMQRSTVRGVSKYDANQKFIEGMNIWKEIAAKYSVYITKPILSQEELNTLMASGDAASKGGKFAEAEEYYNQILEELKFQEMNPNATIYPALGRSIMANGDAALEHGNYSVAERSYRLILDEQKLQNTPPNADIYVALGLSILEQEPDPTATEGFIIDTNTIASSFNKWAGHILDKGTSGKEPPGSHSGYRDESARLEKTYNSDIGFFDRTLEMFNAVLSLDQKNETALQCVNYINQRKSYLGSRRGQIKTALDNIYRYNEAERQRLESERKQADMARITESMNNFANSVAQVQQNQSGRTGGSGGGQGQAASSGGSGGGSGNSSGYRDCKRCGGSGECGKCGNGGAKPGRTRSYSSYTSETLEYKCSICRGTGKCYECRGKGKIRI